MAIDLRLIGAPEELPAAVAAVRSAFKVCSSKQYPSRYGSAARLYMSVLPKPRSPEFQWPDRLEDLKISLRNRGENNHIVVTMDFEAPEYVRHSVASEFNHLVQDAVKEVIYPDAKHVWLRLDQSFKPSASDVVLYQDPSGFHTVYL